MLIHKRSQPSRLTSLTAGSGTAADGLPTPRRWWSAGTIWLAISMSVLDGAIANVALPTIAGELQASPATAVWIVNAYQLAITALLLPLAALGDRLGYRRVYLPGLALFTLGSVACALTDSLPGLIAARMFQGIGAAAIMSMNAALVRATFPASMLGRGIGFNALVLSLSAAAGPTLAAAILEVASWPWLFAVNLPFGLAALFIGMRALPDARGRSGPIDAIAALLSASALGCLVLGTEALVRDGAAVGASLLLYGVVAGTILIRRELHRQAPLVPLDLLKIPLFSLSIATSVVSFSAQMLAFVTLPFLFQSVLGHSVVESGIMMTPWPLAVAAAAPIAGRLADRYPAGLLGGVGLALFACGLFALSAMPPRPEIGDIIWRMALCGLGFGFFQSPNNRAIVGSAPRERSGAAGGMLATARLLGQTTGAVTAAAGFHLIGVRAGPDLLGVAATAATAAALVSLLRLRVDTSGHGQHVEEGMG